MKHKPLLQIIREATTLSGASLFMMASSHQKVHNNGKRNSQFSRKIGNIHIFKVKNEIECILYKGLNKDHVEWDNGNNKETKRITPAPLLERKKERKRRKKKNQPLQGTPEHFDSSEPEFCFSKQ